MNIPSKEERSLHARIARQRFEETGSNYEGIVIPGVGRFAMAAKTRSGVALDLIVNPQEATIRSKESGGAEATGDFGLIVKIRNGVLILVVDPVSGGDRTAPNNARRFVSRAYEQFNGMELSARDSVGRVVSVAERMHDELSGSTRPGSFTLGGLAVDEHGAIQFLLGDAGVVYNNGGGIFPKDKSVEGNDLMRRLGEWQMIGGKRRFVPFQVGYYRPSTHILELPYERDYFREKQMFVMTDFGMKLAGFGEGQSPVNGKVDVFQNALKADNPARYVTDHAVNVDDAVVAYCEFS